MSEEEAYAAFVKLRYAETDGQPFCPACGCVVTYEITAKRALAARSLPSPAFVAC